MTTPIEEGSLISKVFNTIGLHSMQVVTAMTYLLILAPLILSLAGAKGTREEFLEKESGEYAAGMEFMKDGLGGIVNGRVGEVVDGEAQLDLKLNEVESGRKEVEDQRKPLAALEMEEVAGKTADMEGVEVERIEQEMKWLVETINEVGLALHSREQEISDLETLIKDIDLLMMMRLGKKDRDIAELTNGLAAAKTEVDQLTRRVTQVPVVCFNEKSNDMCRIAWFTKTDKKTDTKTQETKTQ